jgi:hypothetical protein
LQCELKLLIMRASCKARSFFAPLLSRYGDLAGPLAMMTCELRQARKGATVAVSYVPGCGWLDCLHSQFYPLIPLVKIP